MHEDQIMRLVAKVAAVNMTNDYANKVYDLLVPIFKPLVGQAITKNDGCLLAKFEKLMPELLNTPSLRCCRDRNPYTLRWTIYGSKSTPTSHCQSHEVTAYIGELNGNILTKIVPPNNYRADFTAEEIRVRREAYKAAKNHADEILAKLYFFGEYDR